MKFLMAQIQIIFIRFTKLFLKLRLIMTTTIIILNVNTKCNFKFPKLQWSGNRDKLFQIKIVLYSFISFLVSLKKKHF